MDHVETHAGETGLDPLLVMAVIRQESLVGHFLVSDIGAVGVMQIMPPKARSLWMKTLIYPSDYDHLLVAFLPGARRSAARKLKSYARAPRRGYKRSQREMTALDERFDTARNIQSDCRYLAKLEQRLGSIDLALAGYYAGPTATWQGLSWPLRRYVTKAKGFLSELPTDGLERYTDDCSLNSLLMSFESPSHLSANSAVSMCRRFRSCSLFCSL